MRPNHSRSSRIAEFRFDNAARLATVANGGEMYTYAYEANSNLVKSMTAGYYRSTRTWESTRDVLASILNTNLAGVPPQTECPN